MTLGRTLSLSVWLASGIAVTAPVSVVAHHAFAAEFDGDKPVELKGAVTKIKWTNPHGWIYLDVKDASGAVSNWAVEFGSPYSLLQRGLRVSDFPVGTEVVIKGHLAKSGKAVANASSVTLPNGRAFFTGASDSPGSERAGR